MKTPFQKNAPRFMLMAASLLFYSLTFGQSFQGTVTYTQDLALSKAFVDMGVTKEMILSKLQKDGEWGDSLKITYDQQGNYRTITNSKKGPITIYRADVNKIYTFADGKGSEKVSVQDAIDIDLEGKPDKPEIKKMDTVVIIHGVKCTGLTVQWKMSKIDYFYNSSELKIDPALYSKHTTNGLADFLKTSGSIPFRIVNNVFGMTVVQSLAASKAETVSPDLFKIPTLVADESLNIIKLPGIVVMRVKK